MQQKRESHNMIYLNVFILIPHFDALMIFSLWNRSCGSQQPNQIAPFQQSLYLRVKRNSSKPVPSPYSCNSVSSAPGSIFQHQLVKQFQIATPTLVYSYSYTTQTLPPSFYPSLCPSSDPISQWNHQKLIPISALDGGPQQCMARLNSAVNSQPFPQRPSLSSVLAPPLPGLHLCLF